MANKWLEAHPMRSLLPGIPKLGREQQNYYLFIDSTSARMKDFLEKNDAD